MALDVLARVSEQVYRIEDRFVNLYVIDAGRVVLVDTGTRSAEARIRAGLRELGKEVDDIAVLLLTHHHLDHVGTAGIWKREAHAEVHLHRMDAAVAAKTERRRGHGVGAKAKVMVAFAGLYTALMAAPPLETDRALDGGEVLDVLGWPIEVIHAPGHTLGSCAFHARSADVLFAGDAVNGRAGRPEPPLLVEDARSALDSYRRLTAMDAAILCPGHGSLVRRPTAGTPKAP